MTNEGHNRKAVVRESIEQLEALADEKADLSERGKDIKGALKEKFPEYTPRVVNRILAKRKLSREVRELEDQAEAQMELDLGMAPELEQAA